MPFDELDCFLEVWIDARGSGETKGRAGAVAGLVIEAPTIEARVNAALDDVRPAIAADGGDVWLVRVTDRVAFVQMVGACGGCEMVLTTLKGAIETAVRAKCPEIDRVEQI